MGPEEGLKKGVDKGGKRAGQGQGPGLLFPSPTFQCPASKLT